MKQLELDLFPKEKNRLGNLLQWSFNVFDSLDDSLSYQLAFSGGKDSHVLLGVYLAWIMERKKRLNLIAIFSDTLLESTPLYELIQLAELVCVKNNIPFVKVQPSVEQSFWYKLVGLGYPVPDHRNRWCTQYLKIAPMKKLGAIPITGSHSGESSKRDKRLSTCGSSECGVDKIERKVEPIAPWKNCDVWDWIILFSDTVLYSGCSEKLMLTYSISESESGSLRMGCFMCPVVSEKRICKQVEDGLIPPFSREIRHLLDELRQAPRIRSARTKKAGAILVDARIEFWEKLRSFFPAMQEHGWISTEIINAVDDLLDSRAYPPTYTEEWIKSEEPIAKVWKKNRTPES